MVIGVSFAVTTQQENLLALPSDDPRLRVFIVDLALCFLVSPAMTELPREVERDEIADGLAAELIVLVH